MQNEFHDKCYYEVILGQLVDNDRFVTEAYNRK